MPKRRPTTQAQPKPKPTIPGTVEHSLKVVGSAYQGPEHNNFYDAENALTLALALLPESGRKRFDRLFRIFQNRSNSTKPRFKVTSMEQFITSNGVQPEVPEPEIRYVDPRHLA
jgi:hypothetical protein